MPDGESQRGKKVIWVDHARSTRSPRVYLPTRFGNEAKRGPSERMDPAIRVDYRFRSLFSQCRLIGESEFSVSRSAVRGKHFPAIVNLSETFSPPRGKETYRYSDSWHGPNAGQVICENRIAPNGWKSTRDRPREKIREVLPAYTFPHLKNQEIIGHVFSKKLLGLVADFQGREEPVDHLFHLWLFQWFTVLDILAGRRCTIVGGMT